MLEADAPGGSSLSDISALHQSMSELHVDQVELKEEDVSELTEDAVLGKLTDCPYHVFVLSETGRPIFMSNNLEEELCGLFALIGVFVSRVEQWDDQLLSISSGDVHVHFSHRKPLILCIVSRTPEQLDDQLSILFDQIISTLSRPQLESIYEKRGDNYDLRRLLKGTDKYMESCVASWRADTSFSQSAIRIIPLQPSDRDFLSSTMASQLTAAKLDGVTFGMVLAHRQIVTIVRHKKYTIKPRDIHILVNLVSGNSSLQLAEAQTWTPICLPKFNDTGFFYAFISYPWEGCPACMILLSIKRDHFDALNEVKKKIVEKLEGNSKFFSSFQSALETPLPFSISQIGAGNDHMWSFVYKNRISRQICISSAKVPIVSREERLRLKRLTDVITDFTRKEDRMKCLFLRRPRDNVLVWVTDKFCLQCVFSPFTSPQAATSLVDRLLKSLKTHEQRYFILHTASF